MTAKQRTGVRAPDGSLYITLTDGAGTLVTAGGGGGSGSLTVGTSTITSGTTTRVLYDNAGVLGEYSVSGTGTTVPLTAGPTFTGTLAATNITASGAIMAGAGNQLGWSTRSRMSSAIDGNIALTNNAGTDLNLLQFGGTSSAYPAFLRVGTQLRLRLADDTADATLQTGAHTMTGAMTYGGVTLSNAVTGTGKMLLDTAPTFASTINYGGVTLTNAVTGTGKMVLDNTPTLVTPALGAATATTISIGGATFTSSGGGSTATFAVLGQGTSQGASGASPAWLAQLSSDTGPRIRVGLNSDDAASIGFGDGASTSRDLFIERVSAATLRFGQKDAAAPVAQTHVVQSVVTGTSNTAGAIYTIKASGGTGTGAAGDVRIQSHTAGSTGTAPGTLIDSWTFQGTTGSFLLNVNAATIGWASRSLISAPADGSFKMSNNAANSFTALVLGTSGTTFNQVRHGGTGILQIKLADNSAYSTLEASMLRSVGSAGSGFTVAGLPAAGSAGRRTHVTDALAPAFGSTVAAGGAVVTPVFDNGTNWIVG